MMLVDSKKDVILNKSQVISERMLLTLYWIVGEKRRKCRWLSSPEMQLF